MPCGANRGIVVYSHLNLNVGRKKKKPTEAFQEEKDFYLHFFKLKYLECSKNNSTFAAENINYSTQLKTLT